MITKTKLKQHIESLPDELIERLILVQKIELGNQQSENGETISENELDKEIGKWFK